MVTGFRYSHSCGDMLCLDGLTIERAHIAVHTFQQAHEGFALLPADAGKSLGATQLGQTPDFVEKRLGLAGEIEAACAAVGRVGTPFDDSPPDWGRSTPMAIVPLLAVLPLVDH